MLITPRKPKGEMRYVLQAQRQLKPEERVVFVFRSLSLSERAHTQDQVFTAEGGVYPQVGTINLFVLRTALLRIEFGRVAAEAWKDEIGQSTVLRAPFSDETLDLFEPATHAEVALAIRTESTVTEEQEGNSVPQSG